MSKKGLFHSLVLRILIVSLMSFTVLSCNGLEEDLRVGEIFFITLLVIDVLATLACSIVAVETNGSKGVGDMGCLWFIFIAFVLIIGHATSIFTLPFYHESRDAVLFTICLCASSAVGLALQYLLIAITSGIYFALRFVLLWFLGLLASLAED